MALSDVESGVGHGRPKGSLLAVVRTCPLDQHIPNRKGRRFCPWSTNVSVV